MLHGGRLLRDTCPFCALPPCAGYADRNLAADTYLHGTRELAVNQRLQQAYYDPYCMRANASLLASAAVSTAPRHMRSDVDRVVFGREMDASEAAEAADGQGASWDRGRIEGEKPPEGSALLERLRQQQPMAAGARPATSWAGPASSYIDVQPLNVSCPRDEVWRRRLGATRATSVEPRPSTAQNMLRNIKATPLFAAEMDRFSRGRIHAHLQRPRPLASRPW